MAMKRRNEALSISLCLTLVGCGAIIPTRIVVKNQTGVTVTHVRIDCVGKVVGDKTIRPSREASFFCYPPNDGALALKYSRSGREETELLDYATPPPIRDDCTVTLNAGGPPTVKCHSS